MRFDVKWIKSGENQLGKGSVSRSGRPEVGIKGTGHLVLKRGIVKTLGVDEMVLTNMLREGDTLGLLFSPRGDGEVSHEHKLFRFNDTRGGEKGLKTDFEQDGVNILPFPEQECIPCKQGNPTGSKLVKGIPTELAFVLDEGLTITREGDDTLLLLDLSKAEARLNESPTG